MSMVQQVSRQEARKADTRGKILDAARTLFAQVGYNPATIDQIANHAGVGRGTFYMHFAGKAALLQAMYLDFQKGIRPLLEGLGKYTEVDEAHVCVWINQYIDFLVSQAASLRALAIVTHAGNGAFLEREYWHGFALDAFGTRIPAFRIAAERQYPEITARAQLILFQLEGLAMALALDNWNADRDIIISELAKTILAFIAKTVAPPESRKKKAVTLLKKSNRVPVLRPPEAR
jgi:AcrR family transcriptional regulator